MSTEGTSAAPKKTDWADDDASSEGSVEEEEQQHQQRHDQRQSGGGGGRVGGDRGNREGGGYRRDPPVFPTSPPYKAFIKVGYDVNADMIGNFFYDGGLDVKDVHILLNADKTSRGLAHVEFGNVEDLQRSLGANGEKLGSRPIIVDVLVARERPAYSSDRGNVRRGYRDDVKDEGGEAWGRAAKTNNDDRHLRQNRSDNIINRSTPMNASASSLRPAATPDVPASAPAPVEKKERVKIVLQARTIPMEAVGLPVVVNKSIFGEGKPADVLTYEKEHKKIEPVAPAAATVADATTAATATVSTTSNASDGPNKVDVKRTSNNNNKSMAERTSSVAEKDTSKIERGQQIKKRSDNHSSSSSTSNDKRVSSNSINNDKSKTNFDKNSSSVATKKKSDYTAASSASDSRSGNKDSSNNNRDKISSRKKNEEGVDNKQQQEQQQKPVKVIKVLTDEEKFQKAQEDFQRLQTGGGSGGSSVTQSKSGAKGKNVFQLLDDDSDDE